jgi:hypothetical protein
MSTLTLGVVTKTAGQQPCAPENQATLRKPHTSAEEAQSAATEFLLDHVGNQLLTGQPQLMVSSTEATWVVPIHLAYLHTGPIGSVGVVAVDDETGLVVAWTPIDQMKMASRMLRERKEPYLTQQFQTFMATHTPAQR